MTDEELIGGLKLGGEFAFQCLIDEFYQPIFRYLWQASGSREDAEDLAGQTMLRVRRDVSKLSHVTSFRAWIYRVAYRELLQLRRRQQLFKLWQKGPPIPVLDSSTDGLLVIFQALMRLSVDQRDAFLFVEIEGLTIAEAAVTLQIPEGTVKSRIHKAKERLRGLLGQTYLISDQPQGEQHEANGPISIATE